MIMLLNQKVRRTPEQLKQLEESLQGEIGKIHFVTVEEKVTSCTLCISEKEVVKFELAVDHLPDGVHSYIRISKGTIDD